MPHRVILARARDAGELFFPPAIDGGAADDASSRSHQVRSAPPPHPHPHPVFTFDLRRCAGAREAKLNARATG